MEFLKIFKKYLLENEKQFFDWNIEEKNLMKEITYKTYERTIFKRQFSNFEYFNWGSID